MIKLVDAKPLKQIPVVEIFGPTIQGEGLDAGKTAYFIRFGGCDFKCSWCDSMHAVDPIEVRKAERLYVAEIRDRLFALDTPPTNSSIIVLSGGNPVLHDLSLLVDLLHTDDLLVAVETQGTIWKDWLNNVDSLVISPKPPSSGMNYSVALLNKFTSKIDKETNMGIKIVVGDDADYEFAVSMRIAYPKTPFYLSVLNDAGSDVESFNLADVLTKYKWLCEKVSYDSRMNGVRVFPQLHTLAWGAEVGR